MQLFKLIKTASFEANVLAAGAAVLLLLKIFFLNRVPSIFVGAYDLGVIVDAVLTSVVASYVFYILVVHVKEQSDREVLRPYVEKHTKQVIDGCISQINEISKASAITLNFNSLSEADVRSAFSTIAPYSQAPLLISAQSEEYADWFQYFIYHKYRSKESIRKLLDQLPFLDAPHVSSLTAIDDCSHFAILSLLNSVKVNSPDLTARAKSFHEYCLLCRELNSHLVRLGFSSASP